MRSFGRSAARGSRLGAAVLIALASVGTTGCEFITGVPGVDRVELSVAPPEFTAGTTASATATAYKDGGSSISHKRRIPALRSSDPSVATVTGSGSAQVFGVAPGTAWIIAESDGKADSVQVRILPTMPASIRISPDFPTPTVGSDVRVEITARSATGAVITGFTPQCQSASNTIAVATASGTGCVVRGVGPGSTTLRVTVNGAVQDFVIQVRNAAIERVTASVRRPIRVSEQVPVQVNIFGANNTPLPTAGRSFVYETTDPTIVSVNQNGVVTAVKPGTATITVTAEGNVQTTTAVEVTQIPVEIVRVSQNPQFRLGVQGAVGVAAFDSLTRQLSLSDRALRFTSSDETVFRVSNTGVVTPLKIGTATLIASVDGKADTTTARVTEVPTARVVIDSNQVRRVPGQTFQYRATVFDSLGRVVTDRRIRWTSNSASATIDATTGLATAVGPGSAGITAEVAQVSGFPAVVTDLATMVVLQTPADRVTASPEALTLRLGESRQVQLTVLDAAGNPLFGRNTAATVDKGGVVAITGAGLVQAIGTGTATITYVALDQFNQPQGRAATVTVSVGGQ
jgi:uncharacterized protein YjdB